MSKYLLDRLNDERNNVNAVTRAILETAETEKRDLTAEESANFDKGTADMIAIGERAKAIQAGIDAERDIAESFRSFGPKSVDAPGAPTLDVRSFLRGDGRKEIDASWHEQRDLTVTTTAGGHLIPTTFGATLREHLVESSGLLQSGVTIMNTTGGGPLDLPYTTSHGAAAAVAINTGYAESDPAFAKRTLGAFKYAQLLQVPNELLQDEVFNIEAYIAKSMGRNLGLVIGPKFITGAGTTEPFGIVTNSTLGATGAASVAGVFTTDFLIDLFFSVIGPHRNDPSAAWLVRDATLGKIRKLKDGDDTYLYSPAATTGEPDRLLGKPIFTDPTVAAVAADAKSVIFGNMSSYVVRFAGPVNLERSDHFAFNAGQATFRASVRTDGLLVDQTGSVKHFVGGAA